MKYILSVIIALSSFMIYAQESLLQKVDSIVESKISTEDPALMVGVVKNGKIIYQKVKGLANLEHQVKATENTRSNIASTAKQYTALMVLQLSIENKLSLEDDIRTYLPNLYPNVKEQIKIRYLLNHTSGIRDYSDLLSLQQKPWWSQVGFDNDDVIKLLEKQQELGFKPGTRYMYSNSGYTILTKIIEKVSDKKFHVYARQFFKNLDMNATEFSSNYMLVIPNKATPYSDWGDGIWKEYPMLTNLNGDGFLYTSLKDQLRFEQAVQNAKFNNNVVLLQIQKSIKNSEITYYGFGLELGDKLNRKAVHHSGSTGSYHAQTLRFPEEKLSVFVMSSNGRIWSGFIAEEVAKVFLSKTDKVITYDKKLSESKGINDLNKIIGQYISENDYVIRIEKNDNNILWRNANNNPIEIYQEKNDVFNKGKNSATKIKFYENEFVVFYDNDKTDTYKKLAESKITLQDFESFEGEYYSSELEIGFTIYLEKDKNLWISFPKRKPKKLEVINRNELLVSDYILKIKRDQFDRVSDIFLTVFRVVNSRFRKKTNLKYQPKIEIQEGSIQVSNIGDKNGTTQILLTKNDKKGNEIWFKKYGGNGYDKANSILKTDNGYLIIGSTSSYGNGNYDVLVFEVNTNGKKLWQNTYGSFYNDYGYSAEKTDKGYLIKGTKQDCPNNTDINRKCNTNVWFIKINKNGKKTYSSIIEEIKN
ncbi:MAG: beta-lactamase family protein [Flavobacteriaceae bacterium]|nr:beta-lactamase family protein [Flavobacteriaceae bacterium]